MSSTHAALPSAPAADPASWRLPLRRGPYLTGTTGPNRLIGLDAARGLALLGMIVAHVGATSCGLTSLEGILALSHGRSSVLFAVIAGFSLGIITGRLEPHRGDRLVRTRLRVLVRSGLLLALGAAMASLGTPVAVILGFYAAWLSLALPFVHLGPRRLLALAAATAVLGPLAVGALITLPAHTGLMVFGTEDGNTAMLSFLVSGAYPGLVWMAYIFLGLGLSRIDWQPARLWRLAAAGALCAVLGYGGAVVVGMVLIPDSHDSPVLVSPRHAQACHEGGAGSVPAVPGDGSIEPADPGPVAPEPITLDEVQEQAPLAGPTGPSLPGLDLESLITARPHTNTTFEALGSGGVAMVVIALAQLVALRHRLLLAPLAAVGSMSLTVYCAHLVVIAAGGLGPGSGNLSALALGGGCIVFAMAWLAVYSRGPLEHILHVVSVRATRAP
ncbi:heparan-alpha-glucosaminide N-acetyltransferase domain-containing protein [Actinomyces slackii]|uniref:Predicted membrane protein n=1 Tax=Actinomyces slackii TaxID=52774 RepID=A0A3S4WJX4_9ACTO|nr:heparan-alpha-glucosaminide N-acetyltransferase domain-containing protein [Actinomyces slackii]VEG74537.1 Predicted membrane protein [Actinomyces slackii]